MGSGPPFPGAFRAITRDCGAISEPIDSIRGGSRRPQDPRRGPFHCFPGARKTAVSASKSTIIPSFSPSFSCRFLPFPSLPPIERFQWVAGGDAPGDFFFPSSGAINDISSRKRPATQAGSFRSDDLSGIIRSLSVPVKLLHEGRQKSSRSPKTTRRAARAGRHGAKRKDVDPSAGPLAPPRAAC